MKGGRGNDTFPRPFRVSSPHLVQFHARTVYNCWHMPIFEYSCSTCRLPKFAALVGVSMHATPPVCPRCGGNELTKLVSRFRRLRSEDAALDDLTDMADTINPDDPKQIRRLVKEMAGSMGDGGDDDFEEMMEEAMDEEAGATGGADDSVLDAGGLD